MVSDRYGNLILLPTLTASELSDIIKKLFNILFGRPSHVMKSWRDKPIRVQARLVPRYMWTTASIEVFWDDHRLVCTGGQFKMTGSQSAAFKEGGSEHHAVLSWGRVRRHRFPYQLQIDGATADDAEVEIENWPMGYIPVLFIVASLVLLFVFLLRP
jgi:hypothetical protein